MNDAIMIIIMKNCKWLSSTSIYRMHEGVGGCEGPRVNSATDLPRRSCFQCKGNSV